MARSIAESAAILAFLSQRAASSPLISLIARYAISLNKKVVAIYPDGLTVSPSRLALSLLSAQGIVGEKDPARLVDVIDAALSPRKSQLLADTDDSALTPRPPISLKPESGIKEALGFLAMFILVTAIFAARIFFAFREKPYEATNFLASREIPGAAFVSLSETSRPAELVKVDLIAPASSLSARACFFFVANNSNGRRFRSAFVGQNRTFYLRSPMEPGSYVLRLYGDCEKSAKSPVLGESGLTVALDSFGAFRAKIDRDRVGPYEDVIVTVEAVPASMILDRAIVGLYKANAPDDQFIYRDVIGQRDQTLTFTAPNEPGDYEIRAYGSGAFLIPQTLVTRLALTVVAPIYDPA
jgi:hypothetical protein